MVDAQLHAQPSDLGRDIILIKGVFHMQRRNDPVA